MGGERLPGLGREPLLEQGGKWEEENELGRAPCRDAPPFIAAGSPSWGGGRASLWVAGGLSVGDGVSSSLRHEVLAWL